MKKVVTAVIMAMAALAMFTLLAYAAPVEKKSNKAAPFTGQFAGTVYGDNGSEAPIHLTLEQSGRQVEGTVKIGSGLFIDGGFCGQGYVPAVTQTASGKTSTKNPRHLDAGSAFNVGGMNVSVDLGSNISTDGETLTTEARINLPWICGPDPEIMGTLHRVK